VLGLDAGAHLVGMRLGSAASASSTCISTLPPSWMSVPRPAMLVAMVTAPGWPPRHDLRLARVLAGVEHVVRDAVLLEEVGQHLDFSMLVVPTRIGWPFSWPRGSP
jgi:hypothetical protein